MYDSTPITRAIVPSITNTILGCLAIALLTSCTQFNRSDVKNAPPSTSPPLVIAATPQTTSRFPSPKGFVNDFASVIDSDSRSRLEALVQKLKEKSKIEFAVVTVDSTNGQSIDDYSLALAKEWGVGPKNLDEGGGLLLLIAVKDRRWRLQVSRSLERDLPNEVCKQLGDQSLPLYKKGDYAGGIEKYANALIARLEKQRKFSMQ